MARFGRAQQATALLPLAVLSAAWTAGLATAGSDSSASADPHALPDGTRVPAHAVRAPASLTPTALTHGIPGTRTGLATASASGIPAVALAAYQRAATVIDAADRTCHMPWQLVAAIGRVESDHGRADGNVLTDRGIDKPGIYGPALDGKHGTVLIKDTDAGQYDQRLEVRPGGRARCSSSRPPGRSSASTPTTTASATRRTSTTPPSAPRSTSAPVPTTSRPRRASAPAVFRYNHSQKYVDLVLAIEQAYLRGDYTSVPNGTTSTDFSLVDPSLGAPTHRPSPTPPPPPSPPPPSPAATTRPAGRPPARRPARRPGPTGGPTHGPTGGPTRRRPSRPARHGAGGGPTVSVPPIPNAGPDAAHHAAGDRAVPGPGSGRQPAHPAPSTACV